MLLPSRSNTGVVSWSDPATAGSPHTIVIRATNSEGFDEETWTLTVTEPFSDPVNLALNQPATQSSTGWGGVAANAADGNTDGLWSSGSITSTYNDVNAWWQVDLGEVGAIDSVDVWRRGDANYWNDFYVFVSDVPFETTGLNGTLNQAGVWSDHIPGQADRPFSVAVNRTGRYVRVQLAGTNYLRLAEVEVWGSPAP